VTAPARVRQVLRPATVLESAPQPRGRQPFARVTVWCPTTSVPPLAGRRRRALLRAARNRPVPCRHRRSSGRPPRRGSPRGARRIARAAMRANHL
jgi:hypothetical protein